MEEKILTTKKNGMAPKGNLRTYHRYFSKQQVPPPGGTLYLYSL